MGKALDRAMVEAAEYERLVAMGDMPRAGAARRTIVDLVGGYEDGVLMLPACVVDRMLRRRSSVLREGRVPESEIDTGRKQSAR